MLPSDAGICTSGEPGASWIIMLTLTCFLPTATILVFLLEYVKLWLPWRPWRIFAHALLGWTLFPLRYLDLMFFRRTSSGRIGNHCFAWFRKPEISK